MKEEIKVGIADYKTSESPNRITTLGLGSCVGICLYDRYPEESGLGGMAHILLPDSRPFKKNIKVGKFADLAVPQMVEELCAGGIPIRNMVAKIAGGANMFRFSDSSPDLDIGRRNVLAVRTILKQLGIPVLAEDTGGHLGRTMILDLEERSVRIVTAGRQVTLL